MMVLGISFVVLSQIILIPIIQSVNRTNQKVLGLFGYIKMDQISNLQRECERFISNYIEDQTFVKRPKK